MYMRHAQISRYKHFSRSERYELSILLKKGYSLRDIARALGRNPASVSREIKNNSAKGQYDSGKANDKARTRRLYSKYQGMKIRENQEIEKYIREKMILGWSPERIAGRIKLESGQSVSFKAIYKYVYYHPVGYSLAKYLKYRGRKRKKKAESKWGEIIKNRVFIGQRPAVINSRLRFGDFEADTMGRTRDASSETLTVARERKSRFILAKKVSQLRYAVDGFKEMFSVIPAKSATLDNGPENTRYHELNLKTYFCDPYSSWQKGSVENAIGLIREYIPKKSDLADYSDEDINAIIDRINNTPMKCLQFRTPREIFESRFLKINKEQCCT